MEIYNCTDFQFAIFAGRLGFPGHSATFIVKGSFDIKHGSVASAIEPDEQIFPTGDEFEEESEEALKYSSDFVYFKPNADASLVGSCYAPNGEATAACPVQFAMGSTSWVLHVFGDRQWQRDLGGYKASYPQAFKKMDLSYANSFGGENFAPNPIGKGATELQLEDGQTLWPLPNIENPDQQITSPEDIVEPAGFAPLNAEWELRKKKLGTFDKKWLEQKWPWFPADFDPTYFNSAPPSMQIAGYIEGNEQLHFTNLHPQIPNYNTQLPGLRIRCFSKTDSQDPSLGKSFQEIEMKLDTLAVDMDKEQLVLVWRGWSTTDSEEMEDIKDILVLSEPLHEEAQTTEACYELLKKRRLELEQEDEELEPETEAGEETEDDSAEAEAIVADMEAESKQLLLASGVDPENLPVPTEEEVTLAEEMLADDDNAPQPWTLEDVRKGIGDKISFFQDDLTTIESAVLDFSGMDLREADLSGLVLKGSSFAGTDLTGAVAVQADLSECNFTGANLAGVDFTGTKLGKSLFQEANLEDAVFESCDAELANFSQIQGQGTDFSNARLTGTTFEQAQLAEVSFEEADLSYTVMRNAQLQNVTFDKAKAIHGDFSSAELTDSRASDECDFTSASFSGSKLTGSNFEGAKCVHASFSYADMHDVNLIATDLSNANFNCADLRQAKLAKALLENTDMRQSNLFEATLEKAVIRASDFSGSNLYSAEFLEAHIENSNFENANLKMTKLDKQSLNL